MIVNKTWLCTSCISGHVIFFPQFLFPNTSELWNRNWHTRAAITLNNSNVNPCHSGGRFGKTVLQQERKWHFVAQLRQTHFIDPVRAQRNLPTGTRDLNHCSIHIVCFRKFPDLWKSAITSPDLGVFGVFGAAVNADIPTRMVQRVILK